MDKEDPQIIKSQHQNDNIQSDLESNLFSNQREPDLETPTVDKNHFSQG